MNLNCGSFCVSYILEKLEISKSNITIPNMIWISELALFLNNHISNKIELFYYNSTLMKDYIIQEDKNFDGFKFIEQVTNSKDITLKEIQLDISELKKEINRSQFLIMCVESKKLNNDNNMNGGHYIILEKDKNNMLVMYNPQKTKMIKKGITYSAAINLCKNYGSWRIVIGKK